MLKTFFHLSVFSGILSAQPFGAGLKLGVPLTDALNVQNVSGFAAATASTHRYEIGPYVEIRLPLKFALEVDALYRSYDFQVAPSTGGPTIGSWEFPVMAKYKLFGGPLRPYVEGGLVFSRLTGVTNGSLLNHRSNYGIALGAGLEIHALVLRISPEIRYDGFAFRNFTGLVESNRNQVALLVGIGF